MDASAERDQALALALAHDARLLSEPADSADEDIRRVIVFCCSHPDVDIHRGTGYWQAAIAEPEGVRVITRHELPGLLDALTVLLAP